MEDKFIVTSSPHIQSEEKTSRIMLDVIIALMPVSIYSIYLNGIRVFWLLSITVLACVLSEYFSRKLMKRNNTISDLSAVVTGIILALNVPSTLPLWIAAVGGVIAIVLVKQLFGGIGQNFMNPAATARVILLISYTGPMTKWSTKVVDAVSTATPLAVLKNGGQALEGITPHFNYWNMFVGVGGSSIGEASVLALLIGAAYLLWRKVITLEIPLSFIGTLAVFTWVFGGKTLFTGDFITHILSGGLILGAFFMATDYSTSPITYKGRIVMGIGCGLLTAIIRLYAGYPEGVSFAIILMNIVVPLIDNYMVPKSFGGEKKIA